MKIQRYSKIVIINNVYLALVDEMSINISVLPQTKLPQTTTGHVSCSEEDTCDSFIIPLPQVLLHLLFILLQAS